MGYHWFDLGGINEESTPGITHFKRGLGGKEYALIGEFGSVSQRYTFLISKKGYVFRLKVTESANNIHRLRRFTQIFMCDRKTRWIYFFILFCTNVRNLRIKSFLKTI